ncbi:MAG: hypothetical protein AAFN09_15780 [Pseudomonadota bacterium]
MTRILILTASLLIAQGVQAGGAQAGGFGQSVPIPSGPYPEQGTFCGPFKLCGPDLVTRDRTG